MDMNPVQTTAVYDPISSMVTMVFILIVISLLIILFAMSMIGRAFGLVTETKPEAPKEKFKLKDGPPYPDCKTNGALGLF
jgi:hypothetical protein